MGLEELRKKRAALDKNATQHLNYIDSIIQESERVSIVARDTSDIMKSLDKHFEGITSLNKTDLTFMFFATMLQTLRWVLTPELQITKINELTPEIDKNDRMESNERNHKGGIYDGKKSGAEYELDELAKYKEAHGDSVTSSQEEFYGKKNSYRSWIEILSQPVPFDAMNALDKNLIPNIAGLNKQNLNGSYNNIYGKNHHVATLGHDPILGWLFGTANIMTNTITFADFKSFDVVQGHRIKSLQEFQPSSELLFSDQAINYASARTLPGIIHECILSTEEDYKRIAAAVIREAIHLASDKYCVEGLPIPLLSAINPQKAQEMIENGWNSLEFNNLLKKDLKQVGVSAGLALIINLIIEVIVTIQSSKPTALGT